MFKSLFSPGTRDVVSVRTKIVAESGAQRSLQSIVDAINRVQGVIEFDLEGRILNANQLFLDLMGYSLGEVQGRHHSMFVVPGEENSDEYRDFWRRLHEGLPDSRVYQRVGKGGRQVWIQASYNPILDSSGRPIKVVKFASDLTELINQTDQTRKTAESVAAATEELSYSIAEIGQNLDSSRSATNKISAITQDSGSLASNLLDSMKSMERIVGLIRGIASQVNMLALNATIEAARAGDAGKGFAVVASEVKNLSDQTAKATDQIGREIGEVQEISAQVAQSIKDTVVGVEQVNEYVSTVATAIQEQGSVTREIASHSTQMVSAVDLIMAKTRSRR